MEIGWPTDVRHVAHVTFDRFHGFLGLPVELEPEVPRRAPSASTKVFGVSTESMQCSYDSRGNSVPTILLLMQKRLYELGGLQTEGIFRITAENGQEEYVRDQLNSGKLPENIDVHCLSGLIKAWFRELPTGVLDSLSSEKVMQCRTEEDCTTLAGLLPPTEAALLDWAINLMADVVQKEQQNKMNAHNVATVFAPNMTQMADPFTALMYAVQVMNFLRLLILKTLQERQEATLPGNATPSCDSIEASTQAATKPVCESPKEPPSTTLPPAPKEPSAASSLHTSQIVNAAQEKTAQSSAIKVDEPICENSEGSTNSARELTAATTNAIPVNSGGKPNEQNQSREEIRTN